MESKIWVPLIYKGNNFDFNFLISDIGEIKNKSTNNILTGRWENRKYYVFVAHNDKVYRVIVGEAQKESKLIRTIMDKPSKVKSPKPLLEDELKDEIEEFVIELMNKHLLEFMDKYKRD